MLNFFDAIVSFFNAIWQFLSNLVSSTLLAIQVISLSLAIPVWLVGFVPAVIGSCIVVVAAIGVIKLILGWGNS